MTNTKPNFSQGVWTTHYAPGHIDTFDILSGGFFVGFQTVGSLPGGVDEAKANAVLMCAAPLMLDTLRKAEAAIEDDDPLLMQIRMAIHTATDTRLIFAAKQPVAA